MRVVITAGASGIGNAIAEKFISQGAQVAICDVDQSAIQQFQKQHQSSIAAQADVTNETEMAHFLSEVETTWGGADVVCANAGTGGPAGNIEDLDYDEWQACIATNIHGSFLTCRWAARVMRAQKSGLIVLTSSTAGLFGYPMRSPYAAAKWAIVGLTKPWQWNSVRRAFVSMQFAQVLSMATAWTVLLPTKPKHAGSQKRAFVSRMFVAYQ